MIIYGTGEKKLDMPHRYVKSRCPHCNEFEITFYFFKKYFHLFWIPAFPIGSRQVAHCEKCGTSYQESIPPALRLELNQAKSQTRTPSYLFSGLIILAVGVSAILYFNDGTTTHYYPSKKKQAQGKYVDEKLEGKWTYWYESGAIESEQYYKNGKEEGLWIWYGEDSTKLKEGNYKNGMYHGKWIFYYPNGKPQEQMVFFENREQGPSAAWYESGQKNYEGDYLRGRQNGSWIYWYENGNKMMEGNFDESGQKTGKWVYFYESGNRNAEIKHEGSLDLTINYWSDKGNQLVKDGNGEMKNFHLNGRPESSGTIRNGLYEGKWFSWYGSGKKKEEGTYAKGEYSLLNSWDTIGMPQVVHGNGYHKSYYPNGVVAFECVYRNGKQHGLLLSRNENNIMISTVNVENGRYEGEAANFRTTGEKYSTGYFKDNLQDSTWTWYHLNGEKESEVIYRNGKKDGEQTFWSESGEVVKREFYKSGDLISEAAENVF